MRLRRVTVRLGPEERRARQSSERVSRGACTSRLGTVIRERRVSLTLSSTLVSRPSSLPKMCHETPVCSGESTLGESAATATASAGPRPRSANSEKEKMSGVGGEVRSLSSSLSLPLWVCALVTNTRALSRTGSPALGPTDGWTNARTHACEGGSKQDKRGTGRMARLGLGKINY